MGDVVNLPVKQVLYWHCSCGCITFLVRDDGQFECSHCEEILDENEVEKCSPTEGKIFAQQGMPEDFTKRQFAKAIVEDDIAAVILLYESGKIRTWGERFADRDHRDWLTHQLDLAERTLNGESLK